MKYPLGYSCSGTMVISVMPISLSTWVTGTRVGYRLEREYRTGDVIVYEAGGALHFGRVAVKEEENTDEETLSVQQDYQTDPEDSTDGDEVSRKQVRGRIITILRRRGL